MTKETSVTIVEDRSIIRVEDGTEIPLISPDACDIRNEDGVDRCYYCGIYICDLGRKKSLPDYFVHPEPGYPVGRCKMILASGRRCRIGVRENFPICWKHGAGRPGRPSGLQPWHMERMRHFPDLPERIIERYQEFLDDPDIIDMRAEMALIDSRISECLGRLETADRNVAWTKVNLAARKLDKIIDLDEIDYDDLVKIQETLSEAVDVQKEDESLWSQITKLVEQRRKLAETERRRIVESKQMLTIEEANQFLAYLINSVQRHVSNPAERLEISKDMRRFTKS